MAAIDQNHEKAGAPADGATSFTDELPKGVRAELGATMLDAPPEYTEPDDTYPTDPEIEYVDNPYAFKEGTDHPTDAGNDADLTEAEKKVSYPNEVLVQKIASGSETIQWRLSERARSAEADPESTYGESHQPDGGDGARAVAAAHGTRVQAILEAGESEDQKVVAAAVGSRHGVEMRNFLDGLKEYDDAHKTDTFAHTKAVVVCTKERQEVIERSGILDGYDVEFREFKEDDVQLPENTGTVILDRTLQHQPANKLHQVDSPVGPSHIKETVNAALLTGTDTPVVTVDVQSGQAKTIPANRFHAENHIAPAEDPKVFYEYYPQMAGRIRQGEERYLNPAKKQFMADVDAIEAEWNQKKAEKLAGLDGEAAERAEAKIDRTYQDRIDQRFLEFQRDGQYRSLNELRRQEDDVRKYMDRPDVPSYSGVNYSPNGVRILQQVAAQVRSDALILISGPKRDAVDGEENKVAPKDLSSSQGPLVTNIVDRPLIRHALDDRGSHFGRPARPGEYGHELVDFASGPKAPQILAAQQAFSEVLSRPREDAETFMNNAGRTLGQYENRITEVAAGVDKVNADFKSAVEQNPHVASDYRLASELAQTLNRYGEYDRNEHDEVPPHARYAAEAALVHAQRAAELVPSASAPLLEVAKAQHTLGDHDAAARALARARQLSPRNAEIYRLGMHVATQQGDLSAYIDNVKRFLRYESGMSTKQTVDTLHNLCTAMSADYYENSTNNQSYKTILAEDTETGKRTLRAIQVADAKRMQAADAWLAAKGAVEELMNSQPYETGSNQERDRIAQMFIDGYDGVRPFVVVTDERTGEQRIEYLPRDSWHDRPPIGSNERYVYEGSMYESDAERPPQALYDMWLESQRKTAPEEVATDSPPETYQLMAYHELVVGVEFDPKTGETKKPVGIPVELLEAHALVVGQSGSGKTEWIKGTVQQVGEMGKCSVIINASDKYGEYDDMAARMEGTRVIRVGIDDVSLRILDPNMAPGNTTPEKVVTTINRFKDYLKTAYGLPQPYESMFEKTAYKVFAANGWDTGHPDYPVANMAPTVPTIGQFVEEWPNIVASDYEASGAPGEVSGLMRGFLPNRLLPLDTEGDSNGKDSKVGHVSKALINGAAVDMEAVLSGQIVLEFGYIADEDLRRLAALAWVDRINDYMTEKAEKEGYNKGTQVFVVIDEAHNIVPASAESKTAQAEEDRVAAVEKFGKKILQSRAVGLSFITATQQLDSVHRTFQDNAAVRWSFAQQGVDGKARTARSASGSEEDATEVQEALHNLKTGEAVISGTGVNTIAVRIPYDPRKIPSMEERVRALRDQPPLPAIAEKVDSKAVAEMARSSQATALRLTVETEIISLLTGTEQSPDVLPEVRAWWQQVATQNPEFAERVLGVVIGRAIDSRSVAIRDSHKAVKMGPIAAKYQRAEATVNSATKETLRKEAEAEEYKVNKEAARKPQELAKEVFATVIGKLNGEPVGHGRYGNAKHVLPHVAVLKSDTERYFGPSPKNDNFAQPLPHRLPGKPIPDHQRVEERSQALRNHALSMTRWVDVNSGMPDSTNRQIILHALMGNDMGAGFFYDLDAYSGGGLDTHERRRVLATGLGVAALRDPASYEFDEALDYPVRATNGR